MTHNASTAPYLAMRYNGVDQAALESYARELIAAGFEVWLAPDAGSGYLTYARDGLWGTLQCSEFEGWDHLMPLVPSREFGSSMHLDPEPDTFTVKAAERCASATNYNAIVGTQRNVGTRAHAPHGYKVTA